MAGTEPMKKTHKLTNLNENSRQWLTECDSTYKIIYLLVKYF